MSRLFISGYETVIRGFNKKSIQDLTFQNNIVNYRVQENVPHEYQRSFRIRTCITRPILSVP